jgi:hypothetical protein
MGLVQKLYYPQITSLSISNGKSKIIIALFVTTMLLSLGEKCFSKGF